MSLTTKNTTSRSNNKKILYSVIGIFILCAVATGIMYGLHTGPFTKKLETHPGSSEQATSKSDTNSSSTKNTPSSSENNTASTKPTENTATSNDSSETKDYVSTPISNPPKNTDPYPIENEHYKIAQNSTTNYTITLYPIVNNPGQSDYHAQLKAYKTETLNYLSGRYGDISHFTFTWNPPDAKDI